MSTSDPSTVTRTLTIVLPESEWRALRTVEPDAIGWLREQIRGRLTASEAGVRSDVPARQTEPPWSPDEH